MVGIQAGIQAGAEAESWKKAACCLAPYGLLSLLPYTTQDHTSPVVTQSTVGQAIHVNH